MHAIRLSIVAGLVGLILGATAVWMANGSHLDEPPLEMRAPQTTPTAEQPSAALRAELADVRARNQQLEDRVHRLQSLLDAERIESAKLRQAAAELGAARQAQAAMETRMREPLAWLAALAPDRFAGLTADELRRMRDLDLSATGVTDEDLRHLRHLESLRTLDLTRTAITNAGLEHLGHIPNLDRLNLRETAVTDAGMQHLRQLPSLRWLSLNMLPVTDDGLAALQGMTSLSFLRLNYTKVSDAGLSHLAGMSSLERLDLWGLAITDAGTDRLWNLPALRHLELGATAISQSWVERFQAEHADCHVRSRWGR